MSLRFTYHFTSWLVDIVDTATPGKSVSFSQKHRISNGNEDDDAVRAPNAHVKWVSLLWHIHKLLETY